MIEPISEEEMNEAISGKSKNGIEKLDEKSKKEIVIKKPKEIVKKKIEKVKKTLPSVKNVSKINFKKQERKDAKKVARAIKRMERIDKKISKRIAKGNKIKEKKIAMENKKRDRRGKKISEKINRESKREKKKIEKKIAKDIRKREKEARRADKIRTKNLKLSEKKIKSNPLKKVKVSKQKKLDVSRIENEDKGSEKNNVEVFSGHCATANYDSRKKDKDFTGLIIFTGVILGAVFGAGILLFKKSVGFSISVFLVIAVVFLVFTRINIYLKKSASVKKMEKVFPDFLQLVSGNLRAGITIDKAILLSARKEFEPLDAEIMRVGKDIATGRSMEKALSNMSDRISSDRIKKTIALITSGIRSGGNLAILLERTASNMRERSFVEKRAASNVLMYEIFIFIAVAIGAPALFALSTILVEAMTGMMSNTPMLDATTMSNINVPISFSGVEVSMNFIIYYSVAFMLAIGILSSFIIGLVSKGDERAGLKYLLPIVILGLVIFGLVRYFLSGFVAGLF